VSLFNNKKKTSCESHSLKHPLHYKQKYAFNQASEKARFDIG